jgi:ribosomal protein L15
MSKFWKMAGIATLVAVLAVGALGTVALAQEGTAASSGWDLRGKLQEAIASILGISVEDYQAAIETAEDQVLEQAVADEWLTQEQADRLQERLDAVPDQDRFGKGFFRMPRMPGLRGESLISVAAEQLDMSESDLIDQLQEGKSIADVAAEKGVDPQTIADAYLAQVQEKLAKAVTNGDITQKQADAMLENLTQRVAEQLEAAGGGCPPGGFGGHGGRGPDSGGLMGRGF